MGDSTDGNGASVNGDGDSKKSIHEEARVVPFPSPGPGSNAPPPKKYTEAQLKMFDQLHQHFESIETLPISLSKKETESAPLSELERFFLTRECLFRYLRATKWNLGDAKTRLEATIRWRREYGTDNLTAEHVEPEAITGKQVVLGFDIHSRPCLYLFPSRQNTRPSPRQVQFLVWALEQVSVLMPPNVETLALLVNFKSSSNSSNPSPGTGRQVLHILQNHYPERLGRALVINVPGFVWLFFKLITPFIDSTTREKLKFNENVRSHVPPEQLDRMFGGDVHFEYKHEIYWPELIKMAQERREQMLERWREQGSKIGASEYILKGGQ
jgi:hypothetical protein